MAYETLGPLTHEVIGAAIDIHRELGPGFPERIYARALHVELRDRKLPYEAEQSVPIRYRSEVVGRHQLDLVVDSKLVVELKAVPVINDLRIAQVLSYLRASRKPLGLILNFSRSRMEIKRVAL